VAAGPSVIGNGCARYHLRGDVQATS
jgi:hypothetical protein